MAMRLDALPPAPGSATAWYRESWPWVLLAGPAIVVVAAMVTLWLAVASDDGVIADDYYKRGLVINQELERARKAEAMRVGAVLEVTAAGMLRLGLTGFDGAAAGPVAVRVRFAHATRAGLDRAATLVRGPEGRYVGSIAPLPPGRWLIAVETDDWRLPAVEAGAATGEIRLGAARAGR
jgi:hypothetical protein